MATSNFRTIQTNFTEGVQFVKNYIPNSTFQNGTVNGWKKFNTVITGGLPTGALTLGSAPSITSFGVTTTNPISGSNSLQIQTAAAWTAGEGIISDVFTIEREDLAKPLTFSFSYEVVANPTNANWSGILGSQTFGIYIYDETIGIEPAAWVQPSGFLGMNQNSGVGQVMGSFQSSFTVGQQYRLAIIALQASSGAITLNVDNVFLGKQMSTVGTPVTDWQPYTPTYSAGWGTVTTTSAFYRRVGDTLEIKGTFTSGLSIGTSACRISIPSGMVIDSTKVTLPALLTGSIAASASASLGASNRADPFIAIGQTTNISFCNTGTGSSQNRLSEINGNNLWSSATQYSFSITGIPIAGLSSSIQMSNATDTRVVAATISGTPASWSANGIVIFPTVQTDSHASYSASTGRYSVPVSGWYQVSCWVGTNNFPNNISLFRDGSLVSIIGAGYASVTGGSSGANGSAVVFANAGQILDIRSSTSSGTASASYLSINRLSGPSVIASTDTVAARYNTASTPTISNGTIINFDVKEYDRTNSTSTGASWKFTAPISGVYTIKCGLYINTSANYAIQLYKTSVTGTASLYARLAEHPSSSNGFISGSTDIYLLAGEYIDIRASIVTGTALLAGSQYNWINILRVGN